MMVHVNFLQMSECIPNASASRSCSLALSVVSSAAFTFSINGATFSPQGPDQKTTRQVSTEKF